MNGFYDKMLNSGMNGVSMPLGPPPLNGIIMAPTTSSSQDYLNSSQTEKSWLNNSLTEKNYLNSSLNLPPEQRFYFNKQKI
jgi:hypothetical protein